MSGPTKQPNDFDAQEADLFARLSPASKLAFSVADAARRHLNEGKVEIDHLLYGLHQNEGTTRSMFLKAGIGDDRILEVLGIDRLNREALSGKIESISRFPPLHEHMRRALATAEEIRAGRGSEQLRMRHLLSGILTVTDCSVVRNLISNHGITFDLDMYEKEEQAAADTAAQESKAAEKSVPADQETVADEAAESRDSQPVWESFSLTVTRAFAWAATAAGQKDGKQIEISPLQLLGGLLFVNEEGKHSPVAEFLLSALEIGLPPGAASGGNAANRIAGLIGVPPTLTAAPLDSLPAIDANTHDALTAAQRLKPQTRTAITARDLVAGLLLAIPPDRVPAALNGLVERGINLSTFPDRFLGYIERRYPDELEYWRAVITGIARRLLSLPTRACIDNDDVRGEIKPEDDRLNIKGEVDRFARLLVAKDVKPPISLGLFGNWGTGKTFFMGLLNSRIKELSNDQTTYVARVAQIDFNAWHYVDTNLWASLAMRIFDGLTRELRPDQNGGVEAIRRDLHSKVESSKKGRQQAVQQQDAAKAKRASARESLSQLETTRAKKSGTQQFMRFGHALTAVMSEKEFKDEKAQVDKIADELGLSRTMKSVDDVRRLAEQMRAIKGSAGGLVSAVGARFTKGRIITSILVIIVALAVIMMLGSLVEAVRASSTWLQAALPDLSRGVVEAVALVSAIVGWATRRAHFVSNAVHKLERLQARLQQAEAQLPLSPEELTLQKEIEEVDAEIQRSTETISEADRRIAEAEAEIQRIDEGGLVYDFLAGRKQNARYLDQLGLISTIRGDFEELGELLKDFKQHGKQPIERIILYIDDLDRCHPDRVVEVLQAVHLLLAFDLFSVVVGVDARWLERSLYRTYVGRGTSGQATAGSRQGSQAFSPQNYLEKIFQIPYSLRGMNERGFEELVGHLIVTRSEHEKNGGSVAASNDSQPVEGQGKGHGEDKQEGDQSKTSGTNQGSAQERVSEDNKEAAGENADEQNHDDVVKEAAKEGNTNDQTPGDAKDKEIDTAQAIEALFLEDWEESYMKALHEFIPTPRLTKRFVNVYRLLRVRATELNFERFVGDEAAGEYQAALLLLAINIGFPAVGGPLLRLLCLRDKTETWEQFLHQIDPESEVSRDYWAKSVRWSPEQKKDVGKIRERLASLSKAPSAGDKAPKFIVPESLEAYVKWAPEVGMYSFQWNLADSDWDSPADQDRSQPKSAGGNA